jgi:hypothetical protein
VLGSRPAVARAQMERGTGPAQQGEPSAFGGSGDLAQDLAHEVGVREGVLRTERLLPAGTDQAHLDLREPLRFRARPVGAGGAFSHAGSGAAAEEERQKNRSTYCGLTPSRGGRHRSGKASVNSGNKSSSSSSLVLALDSSRPAFEHEDDG